MLKQNILRGLISWNCLVGIWKACIHLPNWKRCLRNCSFVFTSAHTLMRSLGHYSTLRNYMQKYAKSEKISKDSTDFASKLRLSSLHINIRNVACMQEVIRLCASSWDKHWLDVQECPWLLPILLYPPNLPSLENVIKDHLQNYSFCSMLRLK